MKIFTIVVSLIFATQIFAATNLETNVDISQGETYACGLITGLRDQVGMIYAAKDFSTGISSYRDRELVLFVVKTQIELQVLRNLEKASELIHNEPVVEKLNFARVALQSAVHNISYKTLDTFINDPQFVSFVVSIYEAKEQGCK